MNSKQAKEKFEDLVQEQLDRNQKMKQNLEIVDYSAKEQVVIGIIGGDGIGPTIIKQAKRILGYLLKDEMQADKIILKEIDGLTIENRIKHMQTVPEGVLKEIKQCDVLLKGPTMTPSKGDNLPNIESANVALRRELDLFANVRPIYIAEKEIDWTFFRENTEGSYALGSRGVEIEDIAFDFRVITTQGVRRIARTAFEFAKNNGKEHVSIVTKANILKKTDGKFLDICYEVARDYPEIKVDDWYVDIMSANLINQDIRTKFEVVILPNLYGDIITDEAAQIQGGVGTAGSANIGRRYAMFEAIHGSAPRMVEQGLTEYANPSSIIRAVEMLLRHIGKIKQANRLLKAMEKCELEEKVIVTGDTNGVTAEEFTSYIMQTIEKL